MVLLQNGKVDPYCSRRLSDANIDFPLVDQSLHMNLYKVHNLPMLHPTLHVHAQYEIEGSYLATVMDGMFITLPTALDVRLCLMMNGHLCMFNQVLYPVEHINWCIYTLFINDKEQIERNCLQKTMNQTTNLAYKLDGYLWAVCQAQSIIQCVDAGYLNVSIATNHT